MLKINNLKLKVGEDESKLVFLARKAVGSRDIKNLTVLKKSVDARDKGNLLYVYNVAFDVPDEGRYVNNNVALYVKPIDTLSALTVGLKYRSAMRPVVVGCGPAGLFCALTLAYAGAKPVLYERGSDAVTRKKKIDDFFLTGVLDTECNVQFGEGGAGTFSDGKLNTLTSSEYIPVVMKEFVLSGAPEEILYINKPHIGTDNLITVSQNLTKRIRELGGEVIFDSKVSKIISRDGAVKGVEVNGEIIDADKVFLAIGHSSRDTITSLNEMGVKLEAKTYSMGVRIEHLQREISYAQYGKNFNLLPPADYKLASKLNDGRSLYTFCMCPGGKVINASSEKGRICVNGMSEYKRDGLNSNSAILVNVTPAEYGDKTPLDGMYYQRQWEEKAFNLSGSYRPPVQLYGDLVKNKVSGGAGKITPGVNGGYVYGDLRECLPDFVIKDIIDGVKLFADKIKGFDSYDAVLTGVETRSSSPVRILRDEDYCSSVKGLYPIGEGAGYAGGITSSAVDGIKGALKQLY